MKNTKVGIIIVTYNAMLWHEKCFKPFEKETIYFSIYIIDNGSVDGTQNFIKENYKHFILYQSETNLGFGKANNIGFNMALKDGCTHFLLLNQDASINMENILKLVEIQKNNKEFGILSPLQMYNTTNVDQFHLQSILRSGKNLLNDLLVSNSNLKELYKIDFTNAAIWLISKECLKKVGGFDPIFPHYGEDDDYAQRANHFGFNIGLCPLIIGFHYRDQIPKRKMTKNLCYSSYLAVLKDYNRSIFISITLVLIRSLIIPIFSNKTDLNDLRASAKAFFLVLMKIPKVYYHKRLNLKNSYCFLNK